MAQGPYPSGPGLRMSLAGWSRHSAWFGGAKTRGRVSLAYTQLGLVPPATCRNVHLTPLPHLLVDWKLLR